jgi:type IV fimbrial biogenesis protein FimT
MFNRCDVTRVVSPKAAAGFSVIELMITVVIAAILVAFALPSFREITIRNNVTEINNQLVQALNLARSEAVRRGAMVEVISTANSSTFSTGWKVIPDANFNGAFDAAELSVNTGSTVPTGYSVCSRSSGGADAAVIFDNTGALKNPQTGFDINVNRPDGKTTMAKHVSVSATGMITSTTGAGTGPSTGSTCS